MLLFNQLGHEASCGCKLVNREQWNDTSLLVIRPGAIPQSPSICRFTTAEPVFESRSNNNVALHSCLPPRPLGSGSVSGKATYWCQHKYYQGLYLVAYSSKRGDMCQHCGDIRPHYQAVRDLCKSALMMTMKNIWQFIESVCSWLLFAGSR